MPVNHTEKWTSARIEWTWNAAYKKMFNKARSIIKEDTCMKFYDETKPLYIQIHLELDWELHYYKQEVVQVALGMK